MNKAWVIIQAIVAVISIIGIATGATHCLMWLGIALGFIWGEYGELQAERRQRAELDRRKREQAREAGLRHT